MQCRSELQYIGPLVVVSSDVLSATRASSAPTSQSHRRASRANSYSQRQRSIAAVWQNACGKCNWAPSSRQLTLFRRRVFAARIVAFPRGARNSPPVVCTISAAEGALRDICRIASSSAPSSLYDTPTVSPILSSTHRQPERGSQGSGFSLATQKLLGPTASAHPARADARVRVRRDAGSLIATRRVPGAARFRYAPDPSGEPLSADPGGDRGFALACTVAWRDLPLPLRRCGRRAREGHGEALLGRWEGWECMRPGARMAIPHVS